MLSPSEKVHSTVHYFEAQKSDIGSYQVTDLPSGFTVKQITHPDIAEYRSVFDRVGGPYKWYSRKQQSDEYVLAEIQHPENELWYLYDDKEVVGMMELDLRKKPDIELVYFGLLSSYQGKGLGKFLMASALARFSKSEFERFWLHTCNFDAPNAVKFYQKAGLRHYKTEEEWVDRRLLEL